MKDLPTVTFAPGGRAACVKGMTWLLVDCSLTHPMVLEAWGVIDRGGSVDEVVGAILSHGMTSAPDFALVAATGEGDLRFVVRGAVAASLVVAGATEELSAHGILTDQTRSGVQGFVLHGSGERVPASLPVVAGILPVDCLSVVLEATDPADSALSAEAAPAAVTAAPEVAAVQPEAEVAAQPELQAEADAKAEPTVAPETAAQSPQPAASASVDDPEVLASIREYERLFGAPESVADSATAEPVAVVEPEPSHPEVAPTPVDPAIEAEVQHPSPVMAVVEASPAVVPAPETPSGGGFIDALPDFFGPLIGGAAASGAASAPSVPTESAAPAIPVVPDGQTAAQASLGALPTPGPMPSADPAPVQGPVPSPAPPAAAQGRTVNRAHLQAAVSAGPTVWAARCPVGHPSQAFAATCRVCGAPIPAQEPQEIPRPLLGRFVVPGAAPIVIDSDLILGRDPHAPQGVSGPQPRLVVLNDPRMEVSSMHASVTLNFWDVCLTDLGSTNGTEIVTPDGRRQRLAQHTPVTIQPGTKVVLAEVLELVFEATG